jgi:hypothetical protein
MGAASMLSLDTQAVRALRRLLAAEMTCQIQDLVYAINGASYDLIDTFTYLQNQAITQIHNLTKETYIVIETPRNRTNLPAERQSIVPDVVHQMEHIQDVTDVAKLGIDASSSVFSYAHFRTSVNRETSRAILRGGSEITPEEQASYAELDKQYFQNIQQIAGIAGMGIAWAVKNAAQGRNQQP